MFVFASVFSLQFRFLFFSAWTVGVASGHLNKGREMKMAGVYPEVSAVGWRNEVLGFHSTDSDLDMHVQHPATCCLF